MIAQETISLKNDLSEIPRLADWVDAFCLNLAIDPVEVLSLQLALEEVVTNIIDHAYTDGAEHFFTVELAAESAAQVTAVVADDGPAYDPLARPEVDITLPLEERPIGGLGVHLVKKLMHSVRYERCEGRNVLTLIWVPGAAQTG